MGKFFTPFENFAFKTFDFSGRASLLEYWLVMPVIWSLIFFLLWGDAVEFWGFLLAREVPPLNPLYWDGIFVFLLTIIPRLSLTVRRLHDSGKSGKWAKLPYTTFAFGLYLVLGLLSALPSVAVSNSLSSGADSEFAAVGMFAMLIAFSSLETMWESAFAAAAVLNAIGWEAIWAALAKLTAAAPDVDTATALKNVQDASGQDGVMMLVAVMLIAAPFVTTFLHFFFMISPTKPDHELASSAPIAGSSLRRKGDTSDNPFAGYKYLYDKSPEQEAAHKEAAKREIKSLYQQRVLGQQ